MECTNCKADALTRAMQEAPLQTNTAEKAYLKIVEWLYLHDKGYDTKLEWRKAFIEELKKNLYL